MTGRWIELADGVLVRRYAELDLSVGLVIGDRGCLVVDTRSDPDQGAELHAAVRDVTRRPCSVVLTHAHFDHCLGTAAFLPAPVWAHPRCRDNLARGGAAQHAEALSWYRAQPVPRDPGPVRPVVPDRVVAEQAELDLGGRRVLLMHPGMGHTDHDVAVWSPDTSVLFAGDLIEPRRAVHAGRAMPGGAGRRADHHGRAAGVTFRPGSHPSRADPARQSVALQGPPTPRIAAHNGSQPALAVSAQAARRVRRPR